MSTVDDVKTERIQFISKAENKLFELLTNQPTSLILSQVVYFYRCFIDKQYNARRSGDKQGQSID